ncbi:MAG: DUF2249 domain-containing protein [Bacteroidetes bacterium]|nr:DUF2249 domain-containing protein [Bacteroidota bacterium]
MLITANTKIGVIINSNPDAIDTLISISKHFVKLKNPILRRVLAPRVTVSEAAKIGKCSVSSILQSLSKIGFEIEEVKLTSVQNPTASITATNKPTFDHQLDVRPSLAEGADPFKQIMKSLSEMKSGQTLLLINSFEPVPLIKILTAKGYHSAVFHEHNDLVHTYIRKSDENNETLTRSAPNELQHKSFDEILLKYRQVLVEIDVTELEMPQPMIKILDTIDHLPLNNALYVHHKKVPVYLLPELKERGYQHVIVHEGTKVKMLIFREEIL